MRWILLTPQYHAIMLVVALAANVLILAVLMAVKRIERKHHVPADQHMRELSETNAHVEPHVCDLLQPSFDFAQKGAE